MHSPGGHAISRPKDPLGDGVSIQGYNNSELSTLTPLASASQLSSNYTAALSPSVSGKGSLCLFLQD